LEVGHRESTGYSDRVADQTYLAALRLLARRELSEAQVRQRLARRQHDPEAIDAAIDRLKGARSIDDDRTAAAIARSELSVRGRGRLRVRRQIEAAGIAPAVAQRAVEDAFAEVDDQALLEGALDRRLRGRTTIADDREMQRLYRYLIGQGFDSDRILKALRRRRT
jgi:regulatory protein